MYSVDTERIDRVIKILKENLDFVNKLEKSLLYYKFFQNLINLVSIFYLSLPFPIVYIVPLIYLFHLYLLLG